MCEDLGVRAQPPRMGELHQQWSSTAGILSLSTPHSISVLQKGNRKVTRPTRRGRSAVQRTAAESLVAKKKFSELQKHKLITTHI